MRDRIRQLVDELNSASEAYYNGKKEQLTDYEWDAKFDELSRLETETGIIFPDSPTQKVSEDSVAGQKEEHEFAALSLAKTKQVADIVKWAEGKPIWVTWKLDGLTLVVTYDGGRLTKVVTRGNGHIGTNITHLAKAVSGIPETIEYKGHVVIRGEAVISYDDFEKFVMESGADYANPRNLASGSLSLKDVEEVHQRHIQWVPFTLVHTDDEMLSWGERMAWLDRNGMKSVEREYIEVPTQENVAASIDRWTERTGTFQFPVDGLVVCFDDTAFAATGSVTGHHATRAGLAFKWQDEAAKTVLQKIEWSCAANTISPVAIFTPVELEGTTVKRASLCNISECKRLGIGDEGTKIQVIKANKIIPKVIAVDEKVGSLDIPDKCPVCHSATEIVESEATGTLTLHCTNFRCPAKQLRRFARFVSKEGMNIDGISEQTIAKFINLGWIKEYADLYLLRRYAVNMASLEGFGERSTLNILNSIDRSRNVEAHRFLYALSIPMCGQDVCKRLLSENKLNEIIEKATTALFDDVFATIKGIGPEKSKQVVAWFKDEENRRIVNNLLQQLKISEPELSPKGQLCEGLTFVITGDVHHYKNRNELKAYIESQGGKVAGSVSGSTSFLINNDVNSTSGKNKKAKELGIEIISEDQFLSQFGTKE